MKTTMYTCDGCGAEEEGTFLPAGWVEVDFTSGTGTVHKEHWGHVLQFCNPFCLTKHLIITRRVGADRIAAMLLEVFDDDLT